jgi:8-oxo-dGTP diphosphatase
MTNGFCVNTEEGIHGKLPVGILNMAKHHEAAKRELHEETGAVSFDIRPIFDYWAGDDSSGATGMVFYADIKGLGNLPESEMERVECFEVLPSNLTYKDITPRLFKHLENNFKYLLLA